MGQGKLTAGKPRQLILKQQQKSLKDNLQKALDGMYSNSVPLSLPLHLSRHACPFLCCLICGSAHLITCSSSLCSSDRHEKYLGCGGQTEDGEKRKGSEGGEAYVNGVPVLILRPISY